MFVVITMILSACKIKKHADFIVVNAKVYTLDSAFSTVEAFAVSNGRIVATGSNQEMRDFFKANEEIDAEGNTIMPGFIDAHAHFFGYGKSLQELDLSGTKSWEQLLERAETYAETNKDGWIIGRGWNQNDWDLKEFPNKSDLDSLFPNRPVLLMRIDGNTAIANQIALDSAKITKDLRVAGGEIGVTDTLLNGILIDKAVDLVRVKIPELSRPQKTKALFDAAADCFVMGITTVDDCGLSYQDVELINELQKSRQLKMRLYAMLSDDSLNYKALIQNGKIKTDYLNVGAFQVFADGSLGSRKACLLNPYSDKKDQTGVMLATQEHLKKVAQKIYGNGFQMCSHAIGDSANRTMLKIYANLLKGKNDRRWRIEHAQIVHPSDLKLFAAYNIVPSVQPTHATSDMYWANKRLGKTRVKNAYAYQNLLQQNGWLALGSDFPLGNINPIYTFYAAVVRKDLQGYPAKGYQTDNALTREQALKGMTIWAAKANFEENEKGSLEPGKFADFVILNQDLMTVEDNKIPQTKVLATYIAGENVFKK